ncbi:MAG: NAD-dependent epimerase/dehydratase family protein [Pseudomonadaceae bacterium]|nr:NAD-dependent epimerase/dehydratase family protein [Pseudomonadaceae bacterium]
MSSALVIGASGFVGSALTNLLASHGGVVRCSRRAEIDLLRIDVERWRDSLTGVDSVYVCAGLAHARHSRSMLAAVNSAAPLALLSAAQQAGVQDFVWLSSAKVLGATAPTPLTETASLHPMDSYAISKAVAEKALLQQARLADTELHIVRPPLVYGADAQANFGLLLKAVLGRWPLPLGAITAPRSMVSVNNLAAFLRHLRGRAGGVWHVKDADDLTITEIVRALQSGVPRPGANLPVPGNWLDRSLRMLGKSNMADALFQPFLLNDQTTRESLDWSAPFAAADELLRCVELRRAELGDARGS